MASWITLLEATLVSSVKYIYFFVAALYVSGFVMFLMLVYIVILFVLDGNKILVPILMTVHKSTENLFPAMIIKFNGRVHFG